MDCDCNTSFTTILVNWQIKAEATGGVGTITPSPQVLDILNRALSENPIKGIFLPLLPIVSNELDADAFSKPSMNVNSESAAAALAAEAHRVLSAAGLDPAAVVRVLAPDVLGIRVCRRCGCTDIFACDEGCEWLTDTLCSACLPKLGPA